MEASHVRDHGLDAAADRVILDYAAEKGLVVVTRDGDFSHLLHLGARRWPSVVQLRMPGLNQPKGQAERILSVLMEWASELSIGAIVTVTQTGTRSRRLPIHGLGEGKA